MVINDSVKNAVLDFWLLPSLLDYESKISVISYEFEILRVFCCKILNDAKEKVRNYKIEQNGTKLWVTIA
jgi:hypothetical protein